MNRSWIVTALALLLIAGVSYGLYLFLRPEALPDQVIYGNGQIEGTEIRVASEVAGQVVEDHVVEGQSVKKGDLLFEIDDAELQLEAQRTKAQIKALRDQRQQTRSKIETARHHLSTAGVDLNRYRKLLDEGIASQQQVDQLENNYEEALGNVNVSRAQLSALGANVETVQAQLGIIERHLAKTRLVAPADGTILAKVFEQGEFAQPGQLAVVLVDLTKVKLRIFVPEADLAKIKLGDPARISVDAFPGKFFKGRVARVDQKAQFTPRDVHMPEERVRTVFGVLLSIDNPGGQLKPGMPADAWILWADNAPWPTHLFVPR